MPYIVEKDYVTGTYLTVDAEAGDGVDPNFIYVANLVDGSGLITLLQVGDARIYDDTLGYDSGTGFRENSELIEILGVGTDAVGHYIHIANPLEKSYTGQLSGNFHQGALAIGDRVEFDIPIKSRWCKIAQIKIVQQTTGPMVISFEIWEETPIYEGNRIEMHKNIIRRNISLDINKGGWYGESLVNNLMIYKDRGAEDQEYNLHCALVNELGSTVSDFHVLLKIAEIGELV